MPSKFFRSLLPLLALLCLRPGETRAESYDPQFSLSLDLLGSAAFTAGASSSTNYGLGGQFFADWRPLPVLSLGTGLDFTGYFSNGGWQASSWNLGGRIFPEGTQKSGELYLQGMAGLNLGPAVRSLMGKYPGNAHASAGLGYRFFLGEGNALDLGVQFDLYSPLSDPVDSFGLKLGWTWLFGPTPADKEKTEPQPTPAPTPLPVTRPVPKKTKPPKTRARAKAHATPTPDPDAPVAYQWVAGDNLESVAEAFLGRGDLYPLLVDANKAALVGPEGLKAGVTLRVPRNPTEAQKASARSKAGSPEYVPWKKVGQAY